MQKLYPYQKFVSESVKDKMTPKSKGDIKKSLEESGRDFGESLQSATFRGIGEEVDEILNIMDEMYTETDDVEIKKEIEKAYAKGLDTAIEDGSYEVIETYVSHKIDGMTKEHFYKAMMFGSEDRYGYGEPTLGMAELLYRDERVNSQLTNREKKHYEERFKKAMNESIRDKMTPKPTEDFKDKSPQELLFGSIENSWLEGVKIAIEKGADINGMGVIDKRKDTPLIAATRKYFYPCVKLLLKLGADVDARGDMKDSALMVAAYFGMTDIVKELLKYNPNPNFVNNWGDELESAIDVPGDQYSDKHDALVELITDYIERYNEKTNESVRDKMTPKSEKDIKKSLEPLMKNVARELTYMSNNKDIIGMEDFEEAYPFVQSKISTVMDLVTDYHYSDPEQIALFLASTYLRADESVRNMMTPRPTDDILLRLDKINFLEKLQTIAEFDLLYLFPDDERIQKALKPRITVDDFMVWLNNGDRRWGDKNMDIPPFIEYEDGPGRWYSKDVMSFLWEHRNDTIDMNISFFRDIWDYEFKVGDEKVTAIAGQLYNQDKLQNESVRDKMTPKSEADVKKALMKSSDSQKLLMSIQYGYFDIFLEVYNGCRKSIEEDEPTKQMIFLEACRYGNYEVVKFMIDKGVDITALDNKALRYAKHNGYDDIVKLLKYHSNDTNESVRDKMTPKSSEDIIKAMGKMTPAEKLEKGSQMNIIELVKQGLEEGADIKYWGNHLSNALIHGNLEMVKLFVDKGMDLNTHGYKSWIFHQANRSGNAELVKYLIEEFNIYYSPTINDCMRYIITNQYIDMVKVMVNHDPVLRKKLIQKAGTLDRHSELIKKCM